MKNSIVYLPKGRIQWIDWIKGWGMIAVVMNHIYGIVYFNERLVWCMVFNVSILVLGGGINSALSVVKKREGFRQYGKNVIRRLMKLWIPYMLSSTVVCIYYYKQFNFKAFKYYLLGFNSQGSYFVCFYTQLMIIAPFLVLLFLAFSYPKWMQILLLGICSLVGVVLNNYTIIGELFLAANFVLGGTYFEVFCIGIFIMLNIEYLKKKTVKIILGVISVIYLAIFFGNGYYEMAWSNPPNQIAIGYSLAIFVVLYYALDFWQMLPINQKIKEILIKPIIILGKNSLWIFLFHFIVITILQERTAVLNCNIEWIKFVVFFFGALCIPLILKSVIDRIYTKFLSIILRRLREIGFLLSE